MLFVMPSIDLLQNPLLTPDQEAGLVPMRNILREIEFPTDTTLTQSVLMNGMVGEILVATAEMSTFIHRQGKGLSTSPESAEDLERRFSMAGFMASGLDMSFKTFGKVISSQLGVLDVAQTEDKQGQEDLKEAKERVGTLGDRLIISRARLAGTLTLQAADLLYNVYPGIGEEASSWQRAREAFDRVRNVKPPVVISAAEGDAYNEIRSRAFDTHTPERITPLIGSVKIGRSKTLNTIRAARKVRKFVQNFGDATQEQILALLENGVDAFLATAPPVAELEPEEIIRGMRTVKKAVRYLGGAAIIDNSIAKDPKVRFVAYLSEELDGYDVKSEQAVFQRDRKVAARREQK